MTHKTLTAALKAGVPAGERHEMEGTIDVNGFTVPESHS